VSQASSKQLHGLPLHDDLNASLTGKLYLYKGPLTDAAKTPIDHGCPWRLWSRHATLVLQGHLDKVKAKFKLPGHMLC